LSIQEIEGVNSVVKAITKASPNISVDLLSARVLTKKALGAHETSAMREELIARCVLEHSATNLVYKERHGHGREFSDRDGMQCDSEVKDELVQPEVD
jgi:hypothetical protein